MLNRIIIFLVLLLSFCPNIYAVETINLTTYYPAPTGNYQTLETTGNVGIGTVAPGAARLSIVGGNVGIGTSAPLGALVVMSGNVGIGERTPIQQLSVTDTVAITNATGAQSLLIGDQGSDPYIFKSSGGVLNIGTGSNWTGSGGTLTEIIRIDTAGNVGIGTLTFNRAALEVMGDIYADGGIICELDMEALSFLYTSDERLKKNISPIHGALAKIQKLNGVSFQWKKNDAKDIGLTAQNVNDVLPELVTTGNNGMLKVKYGNLVAVLVEAVKEQQKQIEELKSDIEKIRENASLKSL